MKEDLLKGIRKLGFRARIISIQHLSELKDELEESYKKGLFNEEFYKERLSSFVYDQSAADMPAPRSIIIAATRQPLFRFNFMFKEKSVSAIVPPTYLHWEETDQRILNSLNELLITKGFHAVAANLPKKLLAVRSGLAKYGKNNIAYITGMGSYFRLAAFISDVPVEEDEWHEAEMLERCENCMACIKLCPAGALTEERFLIRAERCLVFHNEKPGETEFPQWIDSSWHNCLVGCMLCQWNCPANKNYKKYIEEAAEFSEEETEMLSSGMLPETIPEGLIKKMNKFDLLDLSDIIPRNLSALLHK